MEIPYPLGWLGLTAEPDSGVSVEGWRRGWVRRLASVTAGDVGVRRTLILIPPAFWLGLFLIVPLVIVFFYGFAYTDDAYTVQLWPFDPSNYLDALDPASIVIPYLIRTFGIALLTTVVSLFFGSCIAYTSRGLQRKVTVRC